MPQAERTARARWEGNLAEGHGKFSVGSGALRDMPVSWKARVEEPGGSTSPEELIAAAHAACFAMALSHTLTQRGKPPQSLDVSATCRASDAGGKFGITNMDLEVRGRVPGINAQEFDDATRQADQGCPVSNALRNNVAIEVRGTLIR